MRTKRWTYWDNAHDAQGNRLIWKCFYRSRFGMWRSGPSCRHGNLYGCGWYVVRKYEGLIYESVLEGQNSGSDSEIHAGPQGEYGQYVLRPVGGDYPDP